jgi:methyl-accepting chemotaxis protein
MELVPSIKKTANLVREVATTSGEQALGVSQINKAMGLIDQVTQRNASAAEELSSTAEEMELQAKSLQKLMSFFRLELLDQFRPRPFAQEPDASRASIGVSVLQEAYPRTSPRMRIYGNGRHSIRETDDQDFQRF